LGKFKGNFEIYLQFDGFDEKIHKKLRGKDLKDIKKKAIQNLSKHEIPITLVSTIERGINDNEIGRIVEFGLGEEFIRGINFQPICFSGRLNEHDVKKRITITGILKKIEEQTEEKILVNDFVPLPCNVERVAINYLYRSGKEFMPLARGLDIKKYIPFIDNTFNFDADNILEKIKNKPSGYLGCNCFSFLNDMRKIIPKEFILKTKEKKIEHVNQNTFRISVTSFPDAYNFDIKSMQKECVHIITPNLKKIPFSAYNMVHRK
jgi:uncharacterized radical SAM superfamily Fe-S cluster-containing enzyme